MTIHTIDSLNLVHQLWNDAQEELHRKPRHSLQNSRIAAERICKNICSEYALEHNDDPKWQVDFEGFCLGKLTSLLYKAKVIPRIISTNLFTIQHFGNIGSHDIGSESTHLQTQYIESCLAALTSVILWYFEAYAKEDHNHIITELKEQQISNDFNEIFARTQETAHELEQILLGSIHQVEGMSIMAQRHLERSTGTSTHPLMEQIAYSKKKNLFHLDNGDDVEGFEIAQIGNLTGTGTLENRTLEFWREINMALSLTTSFEIAKSLIQNTEWVYYTSANRFIYIMPWESYKKGEHCYSDVLLDLEFFTNGHPEKNPSRSYFWTKPYRDEYGLGLMVTVATPVDDGDQFLGTISLDLSFDLFNRHLRRNKQLECTLILVNEYHQVLGHPTKVDKDDEHISYIWDVETEIKISHRDQLDTLEPANSIALNNCTLFYVPIDHTKWRLYSLSSH